MSQAEITSIATLISTIIVAVLVVWRNYEMIRQTQTVKDETHTVNDKADNIKDTVDKVAQKVDGNIDAMLSMLADIHSVTINKDGS